MPFYLIQFAQVSRLYALVIHTSIYLTNNLRLLLY